MQRAMTLGGGTAASALFAGAVFGYQLLWVAPLAMLLGLVMLSAVAHQTLSTGMRPFDAMRRFAGAPLAWSWALGALIASIVWHFPQYSLASAVLVDLGEAAGIEGLPAAGLGFVVLVWAVLISSLYGRRPELIRVYERLLRYMVWGIVVCFAWVVIRTGISDWGGLFRGFVGFAVPGERNGVLGVTVILSGLSAAVGINMVFLYPYSLLARGWSREHRSLARFDLVAGLFLPFVLVNFLVIGVFAATLFPQGITPESAPELAAALMPLLGPTWSQILFYVGFLAVPITTTVAMSLAGAMAIHEAFGWEPATSSWRWKISALLPQIAFLAAWNARPVWLVIPIAAFLSLAHNVVGWSMYLLLNDRVVLGADRSKSYLWNLGILLQVTLLNGIAITWVFNRLGWW